MFGNKIQEKTTIVGTGPYSVGSASNIIPGWKTWRSKFTSSGARVVTWAVNDDESIWELTYGTFTLGPPDSISRTYVLSSTGSLIDWQAGDVVYLYSSTIAEAHNGATTMHRDAARPWWVQYGFWLKTSTPLAGYEQITHYDGNTDVPIGLSNITNHEVTLYGIPRGYIDGLSTGPNSVTPLTKIDVFSGECMDSTNTVRIKLGATLTKRTGGAWVAGNDANGMGQGLTIGNNTWYYIIAVVVNGIADVYIDTSLSAANKPTGTQYWAVLQAFQTNGSAQIVPWVQDGDTVWYTGAPPTDVNQNNPGTGATLRTLSVPPGFNVMAHLVVSMTNASAATNCSWSLATPGATLIAVTSSFNSSLAVERDPVSIRTNTTQQINSQVNGLGDANVTVVINTLGWTWYRRRNFN